MVRNDVRTLAGRLVALLVLAALALPAAAQGRSNEPIVGASFSSGVVKLGSEVSLRIFVENAERAQPAPLPRVDGLAIGSLAGPNRSFSMESVVGGRSVTRVQYVWSAKVRPLRVGDFELPPIELTVDGKRRETLPLRLTVVEDMRGEELGFFRMRASATRLYEGEPLDLELEFGWDRGIDSSVDYANLMLPWWDSLPGWIDIEDTRRSLNQRRLQVGLNRERNRTVSVGAAGDVEINGRPFRRLVLSRILMPTRSGTLELPKSYLEFRRVVQRSRSFLGRDQTESFYVAADDLTFEVLPLPEDGRPFDFAGAVGDIEVFAETDVRDVDAGDSIKLSVEWSGHGNFEFFDAPKLERDDRFADFRVYGATETKSADRRTVVYDIAPLGPQAIEIPPVRLSYFDTESERYEIIETEPIPIRVRELEGEGLSAQEGEGVFAEDVYDIVQDVERRSIPRGPGSTVVALSLLGLPLAWLGMRTAVRRREDPAAPAVRRKRLAKRELARALARAGSASEQLAALDEFLAARTRTSAGLWAGGDVEAELERRGFAVDASALIALRDVRRELETAAWGGADAALDRDTVRAVGNTLIGGGL